MHWRRRGFEHYVQERDEIGARLLKVERCGSCARIGVNDREVDLLFVCTEIKEELVHLIDHLFDPRVRTVNLVDDEHDWEGARERL